MVVKVSMATGAAMGTGLACAQAFAREDTMGVLADVDVKFEVVK